MNLLIFEYATSVGIDDPTFFNEGMGILNALLSDFNEINHFNNEKINVYYLFSKNFFKEEFLEKWNNCEPILLDLDYNDFALNDWLINNSNSFDACIFMAAEEDLQLYEFTKILEDNNIKLLTPSSDAVLLCSDKSKTYSYLNKQFSNENFLIDSYLINLKEYDLSNKESYNKLFKDYFKLFKNNEKMIIKPSDGVACQGVHLVTSFTEFESKLKENKSSMDYIILQKYITGKSCSVSLISNGTEALPLSLNSQEISFNSGGLEYKGGQVPFNHNMEKSAMDIAKRIVESIPGLKGYVGVDLIISDSNEIFILEINSRLTTPFVALRQLSNKNLCLSILDSAYGKLPKNLKISGSISFKKVGHSLEIKHL